MQVCTGTVGLRTFVTDNSSINSNNLLRASKRINFDSFNHSNKKQQVSFTAKSSLQSDLLRAAVFFKTVFVDVPVLKVLEKAENIVTEPYLKKEIRKAATILNNKAGKQNFNLLFK